MLRASPGNGALSARRVSGYEALALLLEGGSYESSLGWSARNGCRTLRHGWSQMYFRENKSVYRHQSPPFF